MHVAICDDNIADRKQMERLLKRESDRLAKEQGILYIDSFGNPEALLSAQMHYGAYFLDLTASTMDGVPTNGLLLAKKLREIGIDSPIYLCCDKINYRDMDLPEHIFCIDKPIRANELSQAIEQAAATLADTVPRMEFRTTSDGTIYATYEEILYFHEKTEHQTTLYLVDGRSYLVPETAKNIYFNIKPKHDDIYALSEKYAFNPKHLKSATLTTVTYSNGVTCKVGFLNARYARKCLREQRKSS